VTQPAPLPGTPQAPQAPPDAPVEGEGYVVYDKAGNKHTIPIGDVAAQYTAGQVGLDSNVEHHVVTPGGRFRTMSADDAGAVLRAGGRLSTLAEQHKAHLEHAYGGLGGAAAAFGEGALRQGSLGASDPLAVGAARLFGGDQAANEVREHLAGEKEQHPYAELAGGIVGAAIPVLATGGAAAPEEAAALGAGELGGEAGVLARIGSGIKSIGSAPMRNVQALGDVTEGAAESLLGSPAGTVLGRAAQSAAKGAARNIVEGGLFGAGQEISDSTLEDRDMTAEKLFSSVGHGAMFGGLLGAAGGGIGSVARDAAGALADHMNPKLLEARNDQAVKWLAGKHSTIAKAERLGGTNEWGQEVFDSVLSPAMEKDGIMALRMTPEEKLEAVKNAKDKVGDQIGTLLEGNPTTVNLQSHFLDPIDAQISKAGKELLGEEKIAVLERLKNSVKRVFGADALDPEIREMAQQGALDEGLLRGTPEFRHSVNERMAEAAQEHIDKLENVPIPIAEAVKQRRVLQNIAFEETKQLDPKGRVQVLRDITKHWGDSEVEALDEAGRSMGDGLIGKQFRALNKRMSKLYLAEEAATSGRNSHMTNNAFGITDYAPAMAGGAALMAGHPGGLLGIGGMLAHREAKRHGNAYAALMLDRLASMGGISHAVVEHDQAVGKAVQSLVSGKTRKASTKALTPSTSQESFDEARSRVKDLMGMAPSILGEHLAQATQGLSMHTPGVAKSMQATAVKAQQFLASKLPPDPREGAMTLTPKAMTDRVPQVERAKFLRYVEAVDGGPPEIMRRVADGRVTPEDVEALKAVYPKTYDRVRADIAQACAERSTPLDYQARLRLGVLFDLPTDPTMDPQFIQTLQTAYKAKPAPAPSAGSAPTKLGVAQDIASEFSGGGSAK
jgi:hypothetical protein